MIVSCDCCKKQFEARPADRKRGWARFCSKSCKAKHQEKRTGQYARLNSRIGQNVDRWGVQHDSFEEGSKV